MLWTWMHVVKTLKGSGLTICWIDDNFTLQIFSLCIFLAALWVHTAVNVKAMVEKSNWEIKKIKYGYIWWFRVCEIGIKVGPSLSHCNLLWVYSFIYIRIPNKYKDRMSTVDLITFKKTLSQEMNWLRARHQRGAHMWETNQWQARGKTEMETYCKTNRTHVEERTNASHACLCSGPQHMVRGGVSS